MLKFLEALMNLFKDFFLLILGIIGLVILLALFWFVVSVLWGYYFH